MAAVSTAAMSGAAATCTLFMVLMVGCLVSVTSMTLPSTATSLIMAVLVVAVSAAGVAVVGRIELLFRGIPDPPDIDVKGQVLSGKRMVSIYHDGIILDGCYGEDL